MDRFRKLIKHIRKQGLLSTLQRVAIVLLGVDKRRYKRYLAMDASKYPHELKKWYKRETGKTLDLDNPRTYNEKIQWLKLYDSTPVKTMLADKYLVRDWVKETIGEEYLIPLLGVWDRAEDIDFESLPDQFVLKTNHGSGWNIIVCNKSDLCIPEIRKKLNDWLHTNYAFCFGLELHYKDISPRIVAEQYINAGKTPPDYKFLCFNGKVKYIWVDTGRFTDHKRDIFNTDWSLLPFSIEYPNTHLVIERPQNLEKMISLAEQLSADFVHVRVDFYDLNDKIYFGEMTFTPLSGAGLILPQAFDRLMGDLMELPISG